MLIFATGIAQRLCPFFLGHLVTRGFLITHKDMPQSVWLLLDKWSARHGDLYLTTHNIHDRQKNIHAPRGIQTHDHSRRGAIGLRLRPSDHWDWPYFACFVRKFTKITTFWVRIIYNFTYFIISDKHFLWSISFFSPPCCLVVSKTSPK
jgi:hypothetical protein